MSVEGNQRRRGEHRHGTHSGWARHIKNGEEACDSCKAAKAAYDRRWRNVGDNTKRNRLSARAQSKAWRTLAAKYPDEYRELYEAYRDQFFQEEGLVCP